MSSNPEICKIPERTNGGMIHLVLSNSYFIYMTAIILGLILDLFLPVNFWSPLCTYEGIILMIFGSALTYWAQNTSRVTKKEMVIKQTERNFEKGPYKFSRNPTHTGLFLLTLGFGLVMGSFFMIVLSVLSFIISKVIFLPKEERLLENKYGSLYCQYQAKVRTWL